jgi:hypothetical protein
MTGSDFDARGTESGEMLLPRTETDSMSRTVSTSTPVVDNVKLRSVHVRTSAETGESRGYFWAEVTRGGITRPVRVPVTDVGGANWLEAARQAYVLLEGSVSPP